jgi:hypothetical protein
VKSRYPILRLIGVACCLAAVVLLAMGLWKAFWSWRSAAWPTVPAVIAEYASETTNSGGRKTRKGGPSLDVTVLYRYSVDGLDHEGSCVVYGNPRFVDRALRQKLGAAFREGQPFPIAYSPGNPARSVVFPGWNWGGMVTAAIGLVFGLLGAGFLAAMRDEN